MSTLRRDESGGHRSLCPRRGRVGGRRLLRLPAGQQGQPSGQTDYAAQLESLCVDSRKQTEALGQPNEIPISKLYPGTVRIGRAFLKEAKALQPPPDQAAAAKTFLQPARSLLRRPRVRLPVPDDPEERSRVRQRIVNGAIANLDQRRDRGEGARCARRAPCGRSSSAVRRHRPPGRMATSANRLSVMPIESPSRRLIGSARLESPRTS